MSHHRWVKGAKRVPNKIAVGDKLHMRLNIEFYVESRTSTNGGSARV